MQKLVMLCGLPYTGKTFFRKKIAVASDVIISTDDIICKYAQLEGKKWSEVAPLQYANAFRTSMHDYYKAISEGKNIIIDKVNNTVKSRANFLSVVPANYECFAILFDLPPDNELRKRRSQRVDQVISYELAKDLQRDWVDPTLEEGFHEIFSASQVMEMLGVE